MGAHEPELSWEDRRAAAIVVAKMGHAKIVVLDPEGEVVAVLEPSESVPDRFEGAVMRGGIIYEFRLEGEFPINVENIGQVVRASDWLYLNVRFSA